MFTLDDALRLCQKATENFAANCKSPEHVALLKTLKYKVRINTRMRVAAGRARKLVKGDKMVLSMDLSQHVLSKIPEADQFEDVSHELAHLLDFAIRGTSGHDQPWKNLHRMMGGNAERCHQYEVKRNRVKRILLTDTVKGTQHLLTRQTYKKLYHDLVLHNLSTPGRYKTKWLSPEQVLVYIATKKA